MLEKYSALVLEYSEEKFYDENRKSYVRNLEDGKMDSSILGAIVPCKMLKLDDEKVRNTIEGELYLPEEVVYSYHSKLIEPTFDEDFVFIKKVKDGKIIEVNNNEKKYIN